MKTIKEWLQEIPDLEIRQEALENFGKNPLYPEDETCTSLPQAILNAFPWASSKQGHKYWTHIYTSL